MTNRPVTPMQHVSINGRWPLMLPVHRAVRPEWPWWEAARLADMHDKLAGADGALIIDVGAEEGDFPALWASWGLDVLLVEPNPAVWPNIRAIWTANKLAPPAGMFVGFASEVDVPSPPALDAAGAHLLELEDGWPRCAYGPVIGNHGFRHLSQEADVTPQARLDTLTAGRPVHALTMDVEGSELAVLRGAAGVLDNDRPTVWVSIHTDTEWVDDEYPGQGREAVLDFMSSHRYTATFLARDHEEHWRFDPNPLEGLE